MLLGVVTEFTCRNSEVVLKRGETLFCFTDGLYERRGAGGRLGEDALRSLVARHGALPLDRCVAAIAQAVKEYGSAAPQQDDFAILAIRAR